MACNIHSQVIAALALGVAVCYRRRFGHLYRLPLVWLPDWHGIAPNIGSHSECTALRSALLIFLAPTRPPSHGRICPIFLAPTRPPPEPVCYAQLGLDVLIFLEPFGLLPIVPLPERMRQFIPAYKATRIIAEVMIEALPQCLLQVR